MRNRGSRQRYFFRVLLLTVTILVGAMVGRFVPGVKAADGEALFAKTTTVSSNSTYFTDSATDSSGNIYTVGYTYRNTELNFGNGVTVTGGGTTSNNVLIVKYNSLGEAQWARSTVTGPDGSAFLGVSVDNNGGVYAVGSIRGTGQYDFGNSVTAQGTYNLAWNLLIMKYSEDGTPLWANTTVSGASSSEFIRLETDAQGNSYAVGYFSGQTTYDFGNNVSLTGVNTGNNGLLIKYNSSGQAQWARSSTSGAALTRFEDVGLDFSGNIIISGYINGSNQIGFGNDVVTNQGTAIGSSSLVIKYSAAGLAQWVATSKNAPDTIQFVGVDVDPWGNIYAAGKLFEDNLYDFGNNVNTTGAYASDINAVVIKYSSQGIPLWVRSPTSATGYSEYNDVAVSSSGSVYAVGRRSTSNNAAFGEGVEISGGDGSQNILMVKYSTDGVAQFAKGMVSGPSFNLWNGIHIDSQNYLFAMGQAYSTGTYDFGNSVTLSTVNTQYSPLLLKMDQETIDTTSSASSSNGSNVAYQLSSEDLENNTASVTIMPTEDSSTGDQTIEVLVEPGIFNFNSFLSATKVESNNLYTQNEGDNKAQLPKNVVLAGGKILGIISSDSFYWQVGSVQTIWYKAYPPQNTDYVAPIIIPSLQTKKSKITISFTDYELIPPGEPDYRFSPSSLRIARSWDGVNWEVLTDSVVDMSNMTVTATDLVGGYYMIVGK